MKTVEFLFDFASPNAHLAHHVIQGIEARTGARFVYKPVLLGGLFKLTNNQAPMIAFGGIPNKLAYERLEMQRFITQHNVPFKMNPHFPMNTLLIMRMATAAEMEGSLPGFIKALLPPMWEQGKKMDDPEIVVSELSAAGFDADHFMRRAQEESVKSRLLSATQEAADRGAFGIPTFFLDGDIYFGKNTLVEIERRLTEA